MTLTGNRPQIFKGTGKKVAQNVTAMSEEELELVFEAIAEYIDQHPEGPLDDETLWGGPVEIDSRRAGVDY